METANLERDGAALHVERLTKVYAEGTRALDQLSLRVPAGSILDEGAPAELVSRLENAYVEAMRR